MLTVLGPRQRSINRAVRWAILPLGASRVGAPALQSLVRADSISPRDRTKSVIRRMLAGGSWQSDIGTQSTFFGERWATAHRPQICEPNALASGQGLSVSVNRPRLAPSAHGLCKNSGAIGRQPASPFLTNVVAGSEADRYANKVVTGRDGRRWK